MEQKSIQQTLKEPTELACEYASMHGNNKSDECKFFNEKIKPLNTQKKQELVTFKNLVVLISIALVSACNDYKDEDDFEVFEAFQQKDIAGQNINCASLMSTSIPKRTDVGFGRPSYDYSDGIFSFIQESDYQFKQCATEIKAKVDDYCLGNINKVIHEFTGGGDNVGRRYIYFCNDLINEELEKVNFTYQLPTESNKFIVLNHNEIMIDPARIEKISFDRKKFNLWRATIYMIKHGDDYRESHTLYYGNEELWQKALRDISEFASAVEAVSPSNI